MRIVALSLALVLSGCSVGLFKENPLNGCSSQSAGRWCSPSTNDIKLSGANPCGTHKAQYQHSQTNSRVCWG